MPASPVHPHDESHAYKFCPRCGEDISTHASAPAVTNPPIAAPIRLEKRGSLFNASFLICVTVVLGGAWMAGEGNLAIATLLLAIGIPALLIVAIRSLVH